MISGEIVRAAMTFGVSMSRSKVISIGASTAIETESPAGLIERTSGPPTVAKSRSPVPPWGLPARSSTPAAI